MTYCEFHSFMGKESEAHECKDCGLKVEPPKVNQKTMILKEIKDEFRAEAGQETFCEDVEIIALRKIELAFEQGGEVEKNKISKLINSTKSDTEKLTLVVEYLNQS